VCLALCGHIKYEEVAQMRLPQRVAGIMDNFLGTKTEVQVVTEAVVPRIERFDPSKVFAVSGMTPYAHQMFLVMWKRMDLAHVFGFPLWEKGVFQLLHRSFGELEKIFEYYAKSGTAGSSSAGALNTMQQTELIDLALDCGLATDSFPMARVQGVFARADQTDDGKGGDHALELHEFLEALVQLSFSRANPRFGQVGKEHEAPNPLPDCLENMLHQKLLRHADRDRLGEVKVQVVSPGGEVAALLKKRKPALKKVFDTISKAKGGRLLFGKNVLELDVLVNVLGERKVLAELTVTPVTAVKGHVQPEVHSNLSALDIKGAFVSCQDGENGDEGAATIDVDEFLVCLALCGHVKYEEVEQMSLLQRVSGIFANFLGEKDEQKVITEAVVPKVARFNASKVACLNGMESEHHTLFMETWVKMDLSHVFGFPLWEKAVFGLLHRSCWRAAFDILAVCQERHRRLVQRARDGDDAADRAGGPGARLRPGDG